MRRGLETSPVDPEPVQSDTELQAQQYRIHLSEGLREQQPSEENSPAELQGRLEK